MASVWVYAFISLYLCIVFVKADECVTYNFEYGVDSLFRNDTGICAGLQLSPWNPGTYSDVWIDSPHEYSASFVSPTFSLSCGSTFVFPMTSGGTVEMNVYMESNYMDDLITVMVFQTFNGGSDAVIGTVQIIASSTDFADGWQSIKIDLTSGTAAFDGYISIMGMRSPKSLILVDSFRYIPPNVNKDSCVIYEDITTQPTTEVTSTDFTTETTTDFATDFTTETTTDFATDSTTETTTDFATDFTTETTTDFATDSTTETTTDFATDFTTETTTDFATDSTTETTTDFATDSTTETTTDFATDFTTETTTDFATDSTTETTTDFATDFTTEATTDTQGTTTQETDVIEECVTENFETNFDVKFSTDNYLCDGFSSWQLENYSSIDIESPNPESTVFIKPLNVTSCISSFVFKMEPEGIVEATVFMYQVEPLDHIIIIAQRVTDREYDTVAGFIKNHPGNQVFVSGWNVIRFSLLDLTSFDGYLIFIGNADENSTVIVDSIRYIPPQTPPEDASCNVY